MKAESCVSEDKLSTIISESSFVDGMPLNVNSMKDSKVVPYGLYCFQIMAFLLCLTVYYSAEYFLEGQINIYGIPGLVFSFMLMFLMFAVRYSSNSYKDFFHMLFVSEYMNRYYDDIVLDSCADKNVLEDNIKKLGSLEKVVIKKKPSHFLFKPGVAFDNMLALRSNSSDVNVQLKKQYLKACKKYKFDYVDGAGKVFFVGVVTSVYI